MTNAFQRPSLRDILIRLGSVNEASLVGYDDLSESELAKQLLQDKILPEDALYRGIAEQSRLPFIDLENFVISAQLYDLLAAGMAYKHQVIPYNWNGSVLQVVTSSPYDLTLLTKLEQITGVPIRLAVSSASAIVATLKRSEGSSQVLKGVSEELKIEIVKENEAGEEKTIALEDLKQEDAGPVVKLVNTIIHDAISRRASDIHVETYETGIIVKYRIDGVLYEAMDALNTQYQAPLISRLKVMAELDIAEKRVPQDGRFKIRLNKRDIDFRVSVLPSVHGEDVVIRILDKSSVTGSGKGLSLESLGVAPEVITKFRRAIREPYGLVLITGPTGSGKTTSLYGALNELNNGEVKIITIEDPVEYQVPGVVQIPVNEKKNLTFAKGLRSILRHDPDKIMVGEIRDLETVQIALQSALTGHLVFSTVHANNAFDVVGRFTHMGVDLYSLVSALNCVMAQRLIRRVCPHCKQSTTLSDKEIDESALCADSLKTLTLYKSKGCNECHGTGYQGRLAITEYLNLTPTVKEMILNRSSYADLMQQAQRDGMKTLRQSAVDRFIQGETTLQEINRVTFID